MFIKTITFWPICCRLLQRDRNFLSKGKFFFLFVSSSADNHRSKYILVDSNKAKVDTQSTLHCFCSVNLRYISDPRKCIYTKPCSLTSTRWTWTRYNHSITRWSMLATFGGCCCPLSSQAWVRIGVGWSHPPKYVWWPRLGWSVASHMCGKLYFRHLFS